MRGQDAENERVRREHAALRRERAMAWSGSLILHAIILSAALLIVLRSPVALENSVEVILQPSRLPEVTSDPVLSTDEGAAVRMKSFPPPRPDLPLPTPPSDIVISMALPAPTEEKNSFERPLSPLAREWTPEEAYTELTRLLEEYPQFREQVLREMIAGKGFAPDTVQHIDLYLDQIFANGITPSWGRQRQAVEGASSSFNGVSGWRQNSNYGGGFNVIGLLKFLYDLIDGE